MKNWKRPVVQLLTAKELGKHIDLAAFSNCFPIFGR